MKDHRIQMKVYRTQKIFEYKYEIIEQIWNTHIYIKLSNRNKR